MNSGAAVVPTARFVASLEIVLGLLYSILSFADFAALLDDERRRMLECSNALFAVALLLFGLWGFARLRGVRSLHCCGIFIFIFYFCFRRDFESSSGALRCGDDAQPVQTSSTPS